MGKYGYKVQKMPGSYMCRKASALLVGRMSLQGSKGSRSALMDPYNSQATGNPAPWQRRMLQFKININHRRDINQQAADMLSHLKNKGEDDKAL